MIKKIKKFFLVFLGLLALLGTGCSTAQDPRDSQIPWAKPAQWEGGLPGMGGFQHGN